MVDLRSFCLFRRLHYFFKVFRLSVRSKCFFYIQGEK